MSVIEHSATVIKIEGEIVTVDITGHSACMSCSLKDNCGIFDCKTKTINIVSSVSDHYKPGQTVMVGINERHGWTAVFFGYILPLLLILATLFATMYITSDETAAAVYSLMILIPYYLVLMLFKKNFSRRFNFKIIE